MKNLILIFTFFGVLIGLQGVAQNPDHSVIPLTDNFENSTVTEADTSEKLTYLNKLPPLVDRNLFLEIRR